MRTGRVIWVLVFSFLLSQDATAEIRAMRCAGRLVKVGDFEGEVIARCGDPQHVETFEDYPGEWVSKYYEDDFGRFKAPYLLKGPIKKEIWTYQLSPSRLPYYLHFYKGRLTRIQIGGRPDTGTPGKKP